MYYVGIDIAKRSHTATIIDQTGEKQINPFQFNNTKVGFNKLCQKLFATIPNSNSCIIGMEATGHY